MNLTALSQRVSILSGQMADIELRLSIILSSDKNIYTDGNVTFKWIIRDSEFQLVKTLTPLGFDGVESVDEEGLVGDWKLVSAIK